MWLLELPRGFINQSWQTQPTICKQLAPDDLGSLKGLMLSLVSAVGLLPISFIVPGYLARQQCLLLQAPCFLHGTAHESSCLPTCRGCVPGPCLFCLPGELDQKSQKGFCGLLSLLKHRTLEKAISIQSPLFTLSGTQAGPSTLLSPTSLRQELILMPKVPRSCPISAGIISHPVRPSLTVTVRDHIQRKSPGLALCLNVQISVISSRALNHSVEFKRLWIVWSVYFYEIEIIVLHICIALLFHPRPHTCPQLLLLGSNNNPRIRELLRRRCGRMKWRQHKLLSVCNCSVFSFLGPGARVMCIFCNVGNLLPLSRMAPQESRCLFSWKLFALLTYRRCLSFMTPIQFVVTPIERLTPRATRL